ncbi:hypothetical protein K432DRAFT_446001 [Lepidopterella palustris CBS 459.81]|uniref:C2H2-type domain-containing protein n=1 Tax=Lepidopterella palustris CBS 459.81 TaxID=1314670 RepID=A0A8E2E3B1_9PEZI|nr:hypothetical protein K432DRAFT_446001 [Lepidopterella palustris CBS 459.81]
MSELLQHYKEPFIQLALDILMNKISFPTFNTSNNTFSAKTSNTNTLDTNTSDTNTSDTNTSNTNASEQHKPKRNTAERNTSERGGTEHTTFGLNASTSNTSCVDIFHTWPPGFNNEDRSDRSRVRKRGFATSPRDFKSNKRQRTSNSTGERNSQLDKQANETSVHSARSPSIQALRFACPYFKHDPKEYGRRSACSGPGWESVHRLKEHLYRCHADPNRCPRCRIALPDNTALLDHLSSDGQCERHEDGGEAAPSDGFTEDQEKQLRKRARQGQSEIERWKEVYMILFPDDTEHDVPSPFYDFTSNKDSLRTSANVSMLSAEQQQTQLSAIRKNIETAVEEVLLIAAEMLRERIPDIVRASQEEIARQLSKPSAAESEEYPLGGSLSSSLISHTFSPVDNQSSLKLLENQARRPMESTQLSVNVQSKLNSDSFTNSQSAITQPSEPFGLARSLLESTHSPKRRTSNSNLDAGLDFLNDVDWECWDESFINFDWSNLA